MHRRQRRIHLTRHHRILKPHHRHIPRNPPTTLPQRPHRPTAIRSDPTNTASRSGRTPNNRRIPTNPLNSLKSPNTTKSSDHPTPAPTNASRYPANRATPTPISCGPPSHPPPHDPTPTKTPQPTEHPHDCPHPHNTPHPHHPHPPSDPTDHPTPPANPDPPTNPATDHHHATTTTSPHPHAPSPTAAPPAPAPPDDCAIANHNCIDVAANTDRSPAPPPRRTAPQTPAPPTPTPPSHRIRPPRHQRPSRPIRHIPQHLNRPNTASRASTDTCGDPFTTRDAVPRPTPANAATSSNVGRPEDLVRWTDMTRSGVRFEADGWYSHARQLCG